MLGIFLGSPLQDNELKKKSHGLPEINDTGDVFQWMGYLLKVNGKYSEANVPESGYKNGSFKVYCKENVDWSKVNKSNYTQYVSLNKTEAINHEWTCWILLSQAPGKTAGSFFKAHPNNRIKIPAGQTKTMLALSALNAEADNDIEGVPYKGNVIDRVQFPAHYQVSLSTTHGGWGKIMMDSLTTWGGDVTHGNSYQTGIQVESAKSKIAVWPHGDDGEGGFEFRGAYINNIFYPYPSDVWREGNENDKYRGTMPGASNADWRIPPIVCDFTLYNMYDIKLIYTAPSIIVFDPNGGTYKNKTEATVQNIAETKSVDDSEQVAELVKPEQAAEFIGWLPSEILGDGNKGALVERGVKATFNEYDENSEKIDAYSVTYTLKQAAQQPAARMARAVDDDTNTANTKTIEKTSTDPGLVFTAQYTYNQYAEAWTKAPHDTDYKASAAGGTVSMTVVDKTPEYLAPAMVENSKDNGITQANVKEGDVVTFVATPKQGYTFDGWYYTSGERITDFNGDYEEAAYNYQAVAAQKHIIAKFSAVDEVKTSDEIIPYLSFIPQSEENTMIDSVLDGGYVKYNGEIVGTTDIVGGDVYGNSISTGFYVNMDINGGTYDGCNWKITVPAASSDAPIYVKGSSVGGEELITDEGPVKYGEGTIYKLNSGGEKTASYRNSITKVSGDGTVQFGLIFDNIYAPGARAVVELYNSASDTTHTDSAELRNYIGSSADFASSYYVD